MQEETTGRYVGFPCKPWKEGKNDNRARRGILRMQKKKKNLKKMDTNLCSGFYWSVNLFNCPRWCISAEFSLQSVFPVSTFSNIRQEIPLTLPVPRYCFKAFHIKTVRTSVRRQINGTQLGDSGRKMKKNREKLKKIEKNREEHFHGQDDDDLEIAPPPCATSPRIDEMAMEVV